MLDRIRLILRQKCLYNDSQSLLVGVSGGPDSLCLIDILHRLKFPLVVVHINHQLRGEAAAEAQLVRQWAEKAGLPFELGMVDVLGFAREQAISTEEAARILRYQFLFSKAQQYSAQAVTVAHTADDQVETVLMHLLRGAGLAGMRGMPFRTLPNPWSQSIPLIRPLLSTWREEVSAYCQEHGLHPVLDQSNLDITYYRNRLRHELIPYLQQYNPKIQQVIWRTSQLAEADYALLESMVLPAWQDCFVEQGHGYVAFRYSQLKQKLLGLQRSVVRRAIAYLLPGLRDVDYGTVEQILEFIDHPSRSSKVQLANQLCLLLEKDVLWLYSLELDLPTLNYPQGPDQPIDVPIPGTLDLQDGWKLDAEQVGVEALEAEQVFSNPDPYQAWLDAGQLTGKIMVRRRLPGDRYQPLGMDNKTVKISDLMVNAKIPRRARNGWPIVCGGESIVWVPGFQPAQSYCVVKNTRRILHLRISHLRS